MYIVTGTGQPVFKSKRGRKAQAYSACTQAVTKPTRKGVVLIIANDQNQILVAQPVRDNKLWLLPQGGINKGENGIAAAFRELGEELGLRGDQVRMIGKLGDVRFLFEDWKQHVQGKLAEHKGKYRGQKQEVFLFRLAADETAISLSGEGRKQELLGTKWVSIEEIAKGLPDHEPRRTVYEKLRKKVLRALCIS